MAANAWMTKLGIELVIFIGITYVAVGMVMGNTGGFSAWPTAAPGSPGATIPVLNIFVGIINFFWGMLSMLFDLFTFNIPGLPLEVRLILGPLYTGMGIFCIIVFWDKIVFLVNAVLKAIKMIWNFTGGLIFGKMEEEKLE
jgi:hypothetical protein